MHILWAIIVGAIAGWLAGLIMRGSGFGVLVDILVGIVGGWLGSWIFGLLGIAAWGTFGYLIVSVIGAVILIWLVRLIKRA
jgi:uncharacterized membrane protein YeaQ/YmgE (transglycosylase-associated protein family)